MVTGTLEWQTGAKLELLRAQGGKVTTRAPATEDRWVNAHTSLYSPPNHIAILARAIAPKYKDQHTVDSYALEVFKTHSRFYTEATQVTPHDGDPLSFAREVSQTAAFEAGLPPHIRIEIVHKDLLIASKLPEPARRNTKPTICEGPHLRAPTPLRPTFYPSRCISHLSLGTLSLTKVKILKNFSERGGGQAVNGEYLKNANLIPGKNVDNTFCDTPPRKPAQTCQRRKWSNSD